MTRIWKYVGIAVIVLLVFGVLLGGAGLLTGAETERVWRIAESKGYIEAMKASLEAGKNWLMSIF